MPLRPRNAEAQRVLDAVENLVKANDAGGSMAAQLAAHDQVLKAGRSMLQRRRSNATKKLDKINPGRGQPLDSEA